MILGMRASLENKSENHLLILLHRNAEFPQLLDLFRLADTRSIRTIPMLHPLLHGILHDDHGIEDACGKGSEIAVFQILDLAPVDERTGKSLDS